MVARSGPDGLASEENGLLRGMARVASLTMRTLSVREAERAAREELEALAREQAALRRVASEVARAASPAELFSAVAEEVGHLTTGADVALVGRYDAEGGFEFVGGWSNSGAATFIGERVALGGQNVATLVHERNAPARVDRLADDAPATAFARGWALCSAGAPIHIKGQLWGVMTVGSAQPNGLPAGVEHQLADFTELVATAIAKAQAREEVEALAEEQAALRRVATLVARAAPPADVFAAVAEEVGRLIPADRAYVARYEDDDTVTLVSGWRAAGSLPEATQVGARYAADVGVSKLVRETGRAARVDARDDSSGRMAASGNRYAVAAPITVEGRLWGLITAGSEGDEPPPGTEDRLSSFTELLATAIGNAESREQLRRVADEQAALRRVATLVARAAPAQEVFAAVAAEAGQVLPGAHYAIVARYDADRAVDVVGGWGRDGEALTGRRANLGGHNLSSLVHQHGQPARVDRFTDASELSTAARETGMRSGVGAPINVAGELWGVMIVASRDDEAIPAGVEHRLAEFTELVATAIGNTQAREELRAMAAEQAALRRVAMLVAEAAPPAAVLSAVAEEVGRLLPADVVSIGRYDAGSTLTIVASWSEIVEPIPAGLNAPCEQFGLTMVVRKTGQPARIDSYTEQIGALSHAYGVRAAVAVPITVEGNLWGVVTAGATNEYEPLPPQTERRLADFTELLGTAIADTQARGELSTLAEEQSALRRVATLVAEGASPPAVFAAVAEEVGRVIAVDHTFIGRFDADDHVTALAWWSETGQGFPVGFRQSLDAPTLSKVIRDTGRPARMDDYSEVSAQLAVGGGVPPLGIRSAVGAPITVEGRLWGLVATASTREEPSPPGTEQRLADFTELVAAAVANAEAQAALTASRARVVATADETRRRIERDLHDGAQQQLVSLALQLRAAKAIVPPDLAELAAELDRATAGLQAALDELHEFARGIHPANLAEGGLGPALRTLSGRSTVPVELDVRTEGRLADAVEVGAYYVVSEALTNVAKHAQATRATVDVAGDDDVLRVRIGDDGVGGANLGGGSGLIGLKDRVEALGGRIMLRSEPGAGTLLEVELPLAGDPGAR